MELRDFLAVGGLFVGLFGAAYGVAKHRWSKRESRAEALSKVLEPYISAVQHLRQANTHRQDAELLKKAYPPPRPSVLEGVETEQTPFEATPEIIVRHNQLVDLYGKEIDCVEKLLRESESLLASRIFRFPDKVADQLKSLQECVITLYKTVGDGLFDKADVEVAQVRDLYKEIVDAARGWRLNDPIEWARRKFRRDRDVERWDFELSKEEMDRVMDLIRHRVNSQANNGFVVHPPRVMLERPSLVDSDDVIDGLSESVFSVVFQDGKNAMLSLPELMAFVFNLIVLATETRKMESVVEAAYTTGSEAVKVELKFSFAMKHVMTTETVKTLLKKIEFAETPSD